MSENTPSPTMLIHEMSQGHYLSQALYAVAKLGIADFIGEGQSSIAELALAAGADERVLYRVMRALAGFGVLHEEEGRFFSLTSAGQLLRSDHPQSLRHALSSDVKRTTTLSGHLRIASERERTRSNVSLAHQDSSI